MDENKNRHSDKRIKVLRGLFIIQLVFGLTMLKTAAQKNIYVVCTWIPLVVYHGVQNFRINDTLRHHYSEFSKSPFKLSGFYTKLFFHKETLEEIEDQKLRNELLFYRQLVRLSFIWMFSYILLWFRR